MVGPAFCLHRVPGHGINVVFIINFIIVRRKSVRKVRLLSWLLDGETTVSTRAVQRGQGPICSKDPSPQPTQEGLVR